MRQVPANPLHWKIQSHWLHESKAVVFHISSSDGEQAANMEVGSSRQQSWPVRSDGTEIASSHSSDRQQYDSRRGRGANKTIHPCVATDSWHDEGTNGETRAANQCFYCGSSAHSVRDCADRVNKKPARLN